MDTDAIETLGLTPLTKILDSYGRWPMTVSNWTADQFDWKSVSSSIRKSLGESFLFEVYNYLDWQDTNKSSIYVSYYCWNKIKECEISFMIDIYRLINAD